MITGDYPATASAIAQQAGLDASKVLTGDAVEHLDDSELARRASTASVFARIMPEQKLRIVQALKANGEVVAMTGDGVNDAPSLKAAHIGVAMGGRGTDVAREASSIVLLDDDFGSIVTAIRLGRRIYDNVRKAMGFIFAVHVPIAGLALLPLVFGLPIIFGPVHIAFLEMVIDPVCSLAFEAETDEEDVMRRNPRAPNEPLFSWVLIGWSVLQGGLALGFVGASFRDRPISRYARRRGPGAYVLLAGVFDRQSDSGQPLVQHVTGRSVSPSQPDARVDSLNGLDSFGLKSSLASRKYAVPLWPTACRRPSIDARHRDRRADRP